MRATESRLQKPSCWQLIFLQSKVNGAPYNGEELTRQNWTWPKNTYFQRRLHRTKLLKPLERSQASRFGS